MKASYQYYLASATTLIGFTLGFWLHHYQHPFQQCDMAVVELLSDDDILIANGKLMEVINDARVAEDKDPYTTEEFGRLQGWLKQ